ncbi:MAG: TlpA family protein disulfide reductase [Polynucleobacter sp.]
MNRRQFLLGGSIAIIAAAAGALIANWRTSVGSASHEAVKALFEREWFSPDQKPISTADWKNKVLVVNFWASWCPPCVEEMPALDKIQGEYDPKNMLIVGIGIDSPSNIRQFIETTIISYPIVLGGLGGNDINKMLGNPSGALPFTVVINAKGNIAGTKLGKISEDELRKLIKEAI